MGTASAQAVPLGAFAGIATDPLQRVHNVIDAVLGDRDRTVVVGVDDAHPLDDLSAFAVRQLVSRRLATVILTLRSGDVPPDAVTTICKDERLDRLELQPLSPSATARRLSDECGSTQTPALQAATLPIPLTARQREIITLADGGLSTKEIAGGWSA